MFSCDSVRPPIKSLLSIDDCTRFQGRKDNVSWLLRNLSVTFRHGEAFDGGRWAGNVAGGCGVAEVAKKDKMKLSAIGTAS